MGIELRPISDWRKGQWVPPLWRDSLRAASVKVCNAEHLLRCFMLRSELFNWAAPALPLCVEWNAPSWQRCELSSSPPFPPAQLSLDYGLRGELRAEVKFRGMRAEGQTNHDLSSSWQRNSCQASASALRISRPLAFQPHRPRVMEQGVLWDHCRTTAVRPASVEHCSPRSNLPSPTSAFSTSSPTSNPTRSPNGVSGLKMACNTAWSFGVPMVLNSQVPKGDSGQRREEGVGAEPGGQLI